MLSVFAIELKFKHLQEKEEASCLVYFLIKHKPEMLNLPLLNCYNSAGDHGKPYHAGYEANMDTARDDLS